MNTNNNDLPLDALEETRKNLEDLTSPIAKHRKEIEKIFGITNNTIFSSSIINAWNQPPLWKNALTNLIEMTNPISKIGMASIKAFDFYNSAYDFSFPLITKISALNQTLNNSILTSMQHMYDSIKPISIVSPALQWISSLNLSPLHDWFLNINLADDYLERYKELEKEYLNAMFECKWFPYAGWTVDAQILNDVSHILATSRNKAENKRREKRIDEVVFKYYTKKEIKTIKSRWYHSELKPHIKKMLGQAIEAHFRREYALTTTCLATLWEGLIRDKVNMTRINQTKACEKVKELSIANNFDEIYSDFYSKLILCDCSDPENTIEGVPNRNAIGHSQYKKYPNKKSSLNAILITDFLINLKPKAPLEESDNVHA